MNEYRIDIKVRNNLILQKIGEQGYSSVSDFCNKNNLQPSVVGEIINMTTSIFNRDGIFRKPINDIANALGCLTDELFTENQLTTQLKTNKRTLKVQEAEMKFFIENNQNNNLLLEELIDKDTMNEKLLASLQTLTPNEQKVLAMRFGINGHKEHTLYECGLVLDKTCERIRQIEAKALRKLRHSSRADQLREFLENI